MAPNLNFQPNPMMQHPGYKVKSLVGTQAVGLRLGKPHLLRLIVAGPYQSRTPAQGPIRQNSSAGSRMKDLSLVPGGRGRYTENHRDFKLASWEETPM